MAAVIFGTVGLAVVTKTQGMSDLMANGFSCILSANIEDPARRGISPFK